ncbi:LOW QUALITY PROTEIN: probable serine/threonine-protein kinase kinX [Hippoglossus stenolepis]|uniref:LOW QUALITY PROTEIN: probable serine/threonine-protein kinase kinX n=1 Tax=Hippoglossus stenolepis TaxID=195615 RepID=UPI001FAF6021|nr:LOW QUALITY PROTEIN: probable serine/threonine-protein kinase kinX [Hippoglossus stenolepis]
MLQGQEMKRRMSPWGAGYGSGRSSDSAAMASGPPDVMANQEPAEVQEECSGKKKSKFQTFKKFFARKKRKEPSAAGAEAGLKASQSSDNVSKTSENNALTRAEKDKGSGSKISLGNKALSHDSVFVSDSLEANEALGASQDSVHGKVKSLQLQLKQAIRLGSPPSLMCVKRTEDAGTMSEDDGLPCSPPEYTTLHTAMNQAQRNSSISLEGIDSDDDQLPCAASSRAMSPLVVPGDFSQPASPFGCLDNSAAKHKRGLRLKACNKRKAASKLEGKMEGDSVVDEMLNTSVTDAAEEQEEQMSEAVSFDELKPKVEREEEEEEEGEEDMEEEKERSQHSRQSLLRYKEEREDESEAEQDVSHSPDISSPHEPSLSEEEAPDAQPPPSSEPSSRDSSLHSPRATPEPPAGPREYLLDPPGIAYGAEKSRVESELALRADEDEVQENDEEEEEEEESSFLQEVLSSLKTPLTSCSLRLDTEDDVMEMKEETNEKEKEVVEMEDGEKVEEEEAEEDEPVGYQAAPSLMLGHPTEKKEEVSVLSIEEEVAPVEEEAESDEEEEAAAAEEEEEELVVELFIPHSQEEEEEAAAEKEDVEEVEPEEENDMLSRKSEIHAQGERREEEGEREEEVMELEKEPQVDDEGSEKRRRRRRRREGSECKSGGGREAIEEESEEAEEMMENLPDAAAEEVGIAMSLQERDEGVEAVVRDDTTEHTSDDEIPTELGDQVVDKVQEREENSEIVVEGEEIELSEEKSDREDDVETKHPDVDETEEENIEELSSIDTKQEDQTEATATVSARPSSLSLQDLPHETPSEESGAVSPSKTSMIHINLVSPSSEKSLSFFQQSPAAADINDNITEPPSHLAAAAEEEEQADTVEEVEEEKQSALEEEVEEEATPPASVEETANRPSSGSDQSKVRFTITPAWQRSQSLTPPSSPPAVTSSSTSAVAGHGGEEVEAAVKKDPGVKAEPTSSPKVDLVLSPGRARNAGSTAVKPQSNTTASPPCIKPQASAAASTEESSVVAEGNPDNPFGVRLRKTSTLHLFSSEDENTESPIESPIQPTSCKAEPPQPIGVKPSISQPISNKPVLPKKPDVHGDSGVKTKCISDPAAAARGGSGGSDSPSWISVAKQKQRIYKENSQEEITVKKDEPERKTSLPMHVSSVASREQSNKTAESSSKEMSKPSASVEKETRRALSPPTPVPPQPSKTQSLPCPVPPKPLVPPAAAKPPAQPTPAHRPLPAPTPAPVPHKSPSCTSPPSLSKPAPVSPSSKAPQPQSTTVPSTPFASRTAPEKSASRAAGLPGQTPSSQRGLPSAALPQDEPPWMALAKKKAKAWSEMPQIVQ